MFTPVDHDSRPLRIAFITPASNAASMRLHGELSSRGHTVQRIHPRGLWVETSSAGVEVTVRGQPFPDVDVIVHAMSTDFLNGLDALAQLHLQGIPVINLPEAVLLSANKLLAGVAMRRNGIRTPDTIQASDPVSIAVATERFGLPVVLKAPDGAEGKQVRLVEASSELETMTAEVRPPSGIILVQRCIKESLGRDIRGIVVGGRLTGAAQRIAAPGDFRANMHKGGHGAPIELTPEEVFMFESIAEILNLDLAAIDLVRGADGSYALEANSFGGFGFVEAISGNNIAAAMGDLIEARALGQGLVSAPPSRPTHPWGAVGRLRIRLSPGPNKGYRRCFLCARSSDEALNHRSRRDCRAAPFAERRNSSEEGDGIRRGTTSAELQSPQDATCRSACDCHLRRQRLGGLATDARLSTVE